VRAQEGPDRQEGGSNLLTAYTLKALEGRALTERAFYLFQRREIVYGFGVEPQTLISADELSTVRDAWERDGARVAFVPTMGALHEGHLSLVRTARALGAERVVVSIFVNPIQLGPNEDFEKYPRTLKSDLDLLTPLGVDAVFLPNAAMMYPPGFQTYISNKTMSEGLCGASRPGHFDGVLTVVLKLFNLVRPHVAVFGKKDYQQWRLIERMALDLNLRTQVYGADTLREPDGLAMSSRNRYLSPGERGVATRLSKGLFAAKGKKTAEEALAAFHKVVDGPEIRLEYAEVRAQADLKPLTGALSQPAVMIVAGRVGTTRLIDNLELD
jgi:pantoate--beta-alanine ligase